VPHKTKSQLVDELTRAADNLRKVREANALIKDSINQIEPTPIQTAQSVIDPAAIVQGQTERRN